MEEPPKFKSIYKPRTTFQVKTITYINQTVVVVRNQKYLTSLEPFLIKSFQISMTIEKAMVRSSRTLLKLGSNASSQAATKNIEIYTEEPGTKTHST
jgi:hypothetical protein